MALRYLEKFTPAVLGSPISFPRYEQEWQPSSPLRLRYTTIVGASYAYNHVPGVPLREVAEENIRFMLDAVSTQGNLEEQIDAMRSRLLLGAEGKLWMLNSDGSRRWCYAQVAALPEMIFTYRPWQKVMVQCRFFRFSDWQSENPSTGTAIITASGQTFTITNTGNIPQPFVVLRLRANTSAGIINPKLLNQTNGYILETARDSASVNSEIRYMTEVPKVEYSNNDGSSYADDFSQMVVQASPYKYPLLAFPIEPATNTILYTGGVSQSLNIDWSLYGAFA